MNTVRQVIEALVLLTAGVSYFKSEYEGALFLIGLTIYVHMLRRESEGK
jgi:hypothetical protein